MSDGEGVRRTEFKAPQEGGKLKEDGKATSPVAYRITGVVLSLW
jgi:hypothetical protein